MKKLKRKLLFCLISETQFFKNAVGFSYYGVNTNLHHYSYNFLYDRMSEYTSSSIRASIQELVDQGFVDKITRNNYCFVRLTAKGRDKLLSFIPVCICLNRPWDGIWKIAIIKQLKIKGIADFSLRQLRITLLKLGFRPFTRAVYLTPLPINTELKRYLLEKDFSAQIAVIEAKRFVWGDSVQITKDIWQLEKLNSEYQALISKIKILLRKIDRGKNMSEQAKREFSLILDIYFDLLEKDPGLPKKLLPADWPAQLCQAVFSQLCQAQNTNKTRTDIL